MNKLVSINVATPCRRHQDTDEGGKRTENNFEHEVEQGKTGEDTPQWLRAKWFSRHKSDTCEKVIEEWHDECLKDDDNSDEYFSCEDLSRLPLRLRGGSLDEGDDENNSDQDNDEPDDENNSDQDDDEPDKLNFEATDTEQKDA
eukprot:1070457-Amphidinium_carterae.1